MLAQPIKTYRIQLRSKSFAALSLFVSVPKKAKCELRHKLVRDPVRILTYLRFSNIFVSLVLPLNLELWNSENELDSQCYPVREFTCRLCLNWFQSQRIEKALNSTYLRLVNIDIEYLTSTNTDFPMLLNSPHQSVSSWCNCLQIVIQKEKSLILIQKHE